jgi:four helix bundle protein
MADNSKPNDLDERTFRFAVAVRAFVKGLPHTVSNVEDVKLLIRSSGSVAANYIEATESVSRKDFVLRIKYCRKEAKESRLWLRLLDLGTNGAIESKRQALAQEAKELTLIFASIVSKNE